MGRELRLFITAVQFLTRLPTPPPARFEAQWLPRALRYFPLVGALIGVCFAAVWAAARLVLPVQIAVGLALAATLLLTGALHEDGLADTLDGFGGGRTPEDVFTIMRDSRIGAFGAMGLVVTMGLKWTTLSVLPIEAFFDVAIAAQMWSRFCAIGLIWMLPYARPEPSKSSPFAAGLNGIQWLMSGLIGIAGFVGLRYVFWQPPLSGKIWVLTVPALIAAFLSLLAAAYCRRRIAGYTGDCLGAVQQIAELSFLIGGLAMAARPEAVR